MYQVLVTMETLLLLRFVPELPPFPNCPLNTPVSSTAIAQLRLPDLYTEKMPWSEPVIVSTLPHAIAEKSSDSA